MKTGGEARAKGKRGTGHIEGRKGKGREREGKGLKSGQGAREEGDAQLTLLKATSETCVGSVDS